MPEYSQIYAYRAVTLLIYKNNIDFSNTDCWSIHKVFLFFEWYYFLNGLRVLFLVTKFEGRYLQQISFDFVVI